MGYALRSAIAPLLFLLAFPLTPFAADAPPNRVANGDFKQARDGKPESWGAYGNAQKVAQTLTVVT